MTVMTDVKTQDKPTSEVMSECKPCFFVIRVNTENVNVYCVKRSKGDIWDEETNSDLGGGWDKPQMETISLFSSRKKLP